MRRFREIVNETGVDLKNNFMAVGLQGSNLIELQDAPGFELRFDRTHLSVTHVTRETFSKSFNSIHAQFLLWGLLADDSAKKYLAQMAATTSFGVRSRLFLVTGKTRGVFPLAAVSGRESMNLTVGVLIPQYYDVAFKFLDCKDPNGVRLTTKWSPADAPWLIRRLNWIYGPQANITFNLISAEPLSVDLKDPLDKTISSDPERLGQSTYQITGQAFVQDVIGRRQKGVDLNVFFVQKYTSRSRRGLSETFPEDVSVVSDLADPRVLPVTPGSDAFLVNFAHEVAHFVLSSGAEDHFERPDVLLSRHYQSARIDKQLVLDMHHLR